MEPLLENGWPEEDLGADSEPGDSDVDADTEAVLYGLVHHQPPSDDERAADQGPESPSFSVSRWSKASRWDRVKGITNARMSQKNAAASDLAQKMIHSTQEVAVPDFIDINNHNNYHHHHTNQNGPHVVSSKSATPSNSANSTPNSKAKPNLRAVLESLAGYPVHLPLDSKKKKRKKKSPQEKRSMRPFCGTESVLQNGVEKAQDSSTSSPPTEPPRTPQPAGDEAETTHSKYAVNLAKNVSPGTDPDVIELFADSDLESNDSASSIVVVDPPPKTPPPLVLLEDSSDETDKTKTSPAKSVTSMEVQQGELIVHCSATGQQATLDNSVVVISDTEEAPARGKKRKKKKNKRASSPDGQQELPLVNDCSSWTPDMARFYNQHWGGHSLDDVRKKLPGHSRHWRILEVDRYGPLKRTGPNARIRCRNCNQLGHAANRCPDPPKKPMCHMCGETGHREPRCPNKICLRCGRPSMLYTMGCVTCSAPGADPCICTTCGKLGHYLYQCPTAWRGFHLVTSPTNLTNYSARVNLKPAKQLSCCVCARRGHSAYTCPSTRLSIVLPRAAQVVQTPHQPLNVNFRALKQARKKRNRPPSKKRNKKASHVNYTKVS